MCGDTDLVCILPCAVVSKHRNVAGHCLPLGGIISRHPFTFPLLLPTCMGVVEVSKVTHACLPHLGLVETKLRAAIVDPLQLLRDLASAGQDQW